MGPIVGAAAMIALLAASPVIAQTEGTGAATEQPGVSPLEIQRLFDAYAAMQAQEQLQLSDAQYPQFLTRMKVLQEIRRRHQRERGGVLQDLRHLTQQGDADDSRIRERLKALQTLDARAEDELRKAYDGLDGVLTPRQQARFRLFEEQMERRKIELLTRARARARANRGAK